MRSKIAVLSCLLALVLAVPAFAADAAKTAGAKQNTAEEKGTVTEAAADVENIGMASKLAAYSRSAKSPMGLATAATILAATPQKAETRTKETEGGVKGSDAATGKLPEAQALFAEAVAMAKEQKNPALAELIEKQSKAAGATKGRVGGSASTVDRVLAQSVDTYRIKFRGGESARVAVVGDGRTDIDLYVYDENGNLVAKDNDNSSTCVARWTPSWTGEFRVRIRNTGSSGSSYKLITN